MDKKQKLIVALLVVAIVFSLVSIGISVSVGSPIEFNFISRSSEAPATNIGITIESPVLEGDDGN
jgi:flagellar basal body-associated protein FliL